MTTITIPKKLAQQGDLVVMPRKEYEELLRVKKRVASGVVLTPTQRQRIRASERALRRGEFVTLRELRHELGRTRAKTNL